MLLTRVKEYKNEKCNYQDSWLKLVEADKQELMISHEMVQSITNHDEVKSKNSNGFKRKTFHKKIPNK